MAPSQSWLGWWKLKAAIAGQVDRLLASAGFWQMSYWAQLGIVFAVIAVALVILLGPFVLSFFRTVRTGDRPSVMNLVLILLSVPCAVVLLPILGRLLQHVLEKNPGPII